MDTFTISQLAQYAGIKPHTIRIWEQRYDALKPFRSEGNTRYYDNSQLRRLLNITSLNALGYKVSELCVMKDEQLFQLMGDVQKNNNITKHQDYYISRFLTAAMNYDEAGFEKIFSHCLLQFSLKDLYRQIIYPLLVRIGMMWTSNDIPPANEHYISNLFRQKIFTAIDGLPLPTNRERKWVCFLPENEFHELGLLFATYIIRSKGDEVIYLGSNLPLNTLESVVKEVKATHILTFMVTNNSEENFYAYIDTLCEATKQQKLFIAASEKLSAMLSGRSNIRVMNSIEKLEQELIHVV